MNAAGSQLDMEVSSFSDIEGKNENECLRRTSRIRYCSRKMLEAHALLKDKVKTTKSESISRRRSLDDAIKMDDFDSLKQLNVPHTKSGSNYLENLLSSETKLENSQCKSNEKRSNSLDSGTLKMKMNLDQQNKMETDKVSCSGKSKEKKNRINNLSSENKMGTDTISCLGKRQNYREECKVKTADSILISGEKVKKSFKRKMEKDTIKIQKTRKKLKPNNDIKVIKSDKNLKSVMKKQSTKPRSKKELPCKSKKINKNMLYSSNVELMEICNDQFSKRDSSITAINLKGDKILQNIQHTSKDGVENYDNDRKGKKETLRSLRMSNDCNVIENRLLDHIPEKINNEANNILETDKKLPKKNSKVSVSQVKLDKIKYMNINKNVKKGQLKVSKKVSNLSGKDSNNYGKSIKGKKIGAPKILKKFSVVQSVADFNKKAEQNSVIESKQDVNENHIEESCRSLIITEFSSLLSKYGAIKLSSTKKKLGMVPNSFLNLELVMAAINCQYFGFQEVFDWISKCLKLKNVSLTKIFENQFKLFEQFFIHMSKGNMSNEDEEEWSKLRVKYYNLPVISQTSWELVFGYTPKFCNSIIFESPLIKNTSAIKEESNKETFDISLNGFTMEVIEKKSTSNRKVKTENKVVNTECNIKNDLKTKAPVVKKLINDIIVNEELNTKKKSEMKIPMVKIYGYLPKISTEKLTSENSSIEMKLENNNSSMIINKKDRMSCIKSVDNRNKTVLDKLCNKGQNKKTKSRKIQLKDTLWNSKKKITDKVDQNCAIEIEEQNEMSIKGDTQIKKLELIETSEKLESKADNNNEELIKFYSNKSKTASNQDCKSNDLLCCNASKSIDLQPKKNLKEKSCERKLKRGKIEDIVEKLQKKHQLPISKELSKESVKIDDSHFANVRKNNVPKKDSCIKQKPNKELVIEKPKETDSDNVDVSSKNSKLQPKQNYSIKPQREKYLERSSEKVISMDKRQTSQLYIPKESDTLADINISIVEEINIPKKDKGIKRKLNRELIKEEIVSSDVNITLKEKKLRSASIFQRKLHKEECLGKHSKNDSIDNKMDNLPQTQELYLPKKTSGAENAQFSEINKNDKTENGQCINKKLDKELNEERSTEIEYHENIESNEEPKENFAAEDAHFPNIKEIEVPKIEKYIARKLDKEFAREKMTEIDYCDLNIENKEKLLRPLDHKRKFLDENPVKGNMDIKVANLPKKPEITLVRTNDYDIFNKKVDIGKIDKCKNKKFNEKLSKEMDKEWECNTEKMDYSKKLLKLTSIDSRKTHIENGIKENFEQENINNVNKVEKLPQVLTLSKKTVSTDDSHFSNIKEANLSIKNGDGKLDEELSEENSIDRQCNNVNAKISEKNVSEFIMNTSTVITNKKKDVIDISTEKKSSDMPESFKQGQIIPTLVNYFRKEDIINLNNVIEKLKLIQVIVANVFCEKNILNLSKCFVQENRNEDTHKVGSHIHYTSDVNAKIPLEAWEGNLKRSVKIVKASELETSENVSTNKKLPDVTSVSMIKTANTIDPKVSILSQSDESLQITLSGTARDNPSSLETSEITHKSPQKKISESCTCCKCLYDIKSQLEELFCNNIQYEESLDEIKNEIILESNSMGDNENIFETQKRISIDACMHQNAFLKQNLDKFKKTYQKDTEKLAASYICELEKQAKIHKEYRKKCIEDTNKLQGQLKFYENLNGYIEAENKIELEKQSKRLMEEHKQEMEKQRLGYITKLKKTEELKNKEKYVSELEKQKENLIEQNTKLEEDKIKLQKQIVDLEKINQSVLIDKKKEIENQYRKLTEEHNKHLDEQRERHITQLKKLEEHKKLLKSQLSQKNKILSKYIQNKKDVTPGISSAANNSLKPANYDDNQRSSKILNLESGSEYRSIDTYKGKLFLKEKLENLTKYKPESSCDIVAKIAKQSDNKVNVDSQNSVLNEKLNENNGSLSSHSPFEVNHNSFKFFPSSTLHAQPIKHTTEVIELSPRKDVLPISTEKKKINFEEYRSRNCNKLSKDKEELDKCSTYIIRHGSSSDLDYNKTKKYEERIQDYANSEIACKMCETVRHENKRCKEKLEKLLCELQELKENRAEKDNDVNTVKADMYSRNQMMDTLIEDTNNSIKSNMEVLVKSNIGLKPENGSLIRIYEDMKYEKNEKMKAYDNSKEINDKHIENEISKDNLWKLCEKVQYENKLLKKEMDKLHIDLGNSKLKFSVEQTRFKKEIDVKDKYINQLQKENVKKDGKLIDQEIVIQRLALIEKRYSELNKDKQMSAKNLENICDGSEKQGETEEWKKDFMEEQDISSPEKNLLNENINVKKKLEQLERNSDTIHEKMKLMSSQLIQNQKENEKLEEKAKELEILLFEEQSKVKLLETKQKNIEKQQLECSMKQKNNFGNITQKKVKCIQQKSVELYNSVEIDQKVSVKFEGSIKTGLRRKNHLCLKIEEQKQEISRLSNAFEKEKEAAEYYGQHLIYQRSRNASLEERLSTVYRDTLRELTIQLCLLDGSAERYRSIMNDLSDLEGNHNETADISKNNENRNEISVQNECLDLTGSNSRLPAISDIEIKPVDLERAILQNM